MATMKFEHEELMYSVNEDVFIERQRQNEKWGLQRHDMGVWLAILVEEVGEVAQAMQEGLVSQKETDASNLYMELIQVAAVASAMAEQVKEEQATGKLKPPKENRPTGTIIKDL